MHKETVHKETVHTGSVANSASGQQSADDSLADGNSGLSEVIEYGLEVLVDDQGLPLSFDEERFESGGVESAEDGISRVRGGVSLLRDYATLPLLAYLRHRLAVDRIPEEESELSAAERGQLLHAVMERYWREVLHHQSLQALKIEQNEVRLREFIERELERVNAARYRKLTGNQCKIETDAMANLLAAWLEMEKAREPFSVIASEMPVSYRHENYLLTGRIDRLDLLENGSLALFDYKTGSASISQLVGESASDIQLPLYMLALNSQSQNAEQIKENCEARFGEAGILSNERVEVVGFANLSAGNLGFSGVSREAVESLSPFGIRSADNVKDSEWNSWQAIEEQWQASLENSLSLMFAGDAHMLAEAPADQSAYQPFLRAGFSYNTIGRHCVQSVVATEKTTSIKDRREGQP